VAAGVDLDLTYRLGPIEPVLAKLDPILAQPAQLTAQELDDLVAFVRDGLLDPRAGKQPMCALVPTTVPSGLAPTTFESCN
jgi:cytochrome c peroxidase